MCLAQHSRKLKRAGHLKYAAMKFSVRQWFLGFFLLFLMAGGAGAQEPLTELVRRVKPSVVAVVTFDAKGAQLSQGSGFFIATDRIVTNRHVLEGAYRAEIHLTDNKEGFPVKGLLSVDGAGDIVLLQASVPVQWAVPLPVVPDLPQEGESVIVIGNPLGLAGSVSNGIVSAVRDVAGFGRILQISAPISQGSSGSPVINLQGQVIGVVTLQLNEGQSLNFAVPSARVLKLPVDALITLREFTETAAKNQQAAADRLYLQGLAFLSRDDCEHALPYFTHATEADATYVAAWTQSGFCYAALGRHAEAAAASRKAIALQPDAPAAYLNLGAALMRLEQFKEAAEIYQQASKLDPSNPDPLFALGLAYGRLGRFDNEAQAYQQTIKIKPEYVAAHERLGLAYLKLNRPQEAINAFKKVILLKPADAPAFDNLGTAYCKAKLYQESSGAYQQAIRLNPSFTKAYYNLGVCQYAAGDTAAALEQYNILKSLDPDRAARLYNVITP